jgi:hypothetical protein
MIEETLRTRPERENLLVSKHPAKVPIIPNSLRIPTHVLSDMLVVILSIS